MKAVGGNASQRQLIEQAIARLGTPDAVVAEYRVKVQRVWNTMQDALNHTDEELSVRPNGKPAECGTTGGCRRHYRLGETPCDACREAKRAADVGRVRG